jgi:RHS repeat-associated protein
VWEWESDPFGVAEANEDPDGDDVGLTYNLRFPGQYYDEETGKHYNYFRGYDPSTGRYVESDPIGLEGGLNTYLYVDANPVNRMDLYGLTDTGAAVGAGIGCGIGGFLGSTAGGAGGGLGGLICGPGAIACSPAAASAGAAAGGTVGCGVGGAIGAYVGDVISNMCSDDEGDLEKRCEEQLNMDMEMCDAIGRAEQFGRRPKGAAARCRSTAMERYGNCLAGRDRGPLDTWNN